MNKLFFTAGAITFVAATPVVGAFASILAGALIAVPVINLKRKFF